MTDEDAGIRERRLTSEGKQHERTPDEGTTSDIMTSYISWKSVQVWLKVDSLLPVLAGLVLLITSLSCSRDPRRLKYKPLLLGSTGSDVFGWSILALSVIGLACVALGTLTVTRKNKLSFNMHISFTVILLVISFTLGILLTEHKAKLRDRLQMSLYEHFQDMVKSMERYGTGFGMSEAWDFVQIQMSCCGINGYKDYIEMSKLRDGLVPLSCCVLKKPVAAPIPENQSQCQHDAQRRVSESLFLHVKGCHLPLSNWATRSMSLLIAILFVSICLQAGCVMYLSWQGYKRSASREARLQYMN